MISFLFDLGLSIAASSANFVIFCWIFISEVITCAICAGDCVCDGSGVCIDCGCRLFI